MDDDTLKIIKSEVSQNLKIIKNDIKKMKENSCNGFSLDETIRTVHSLKGILSIAGYDNLPEVVNLIESILTEIDDDKSCNNGSYLDLLLEGLDVVEKNTEKDNGGCGDIEKKLSDVLRKIKE